MQVLYFMQSCILGTEQEKSCLIVGAEPGRMVACFSQSTGRTSCYFFGTCEMP